MTDDDAPNTSPTGEPAICAAARELVGLTEDDDAFRELVDPDGPPAEEAQVAHGVSACMLVACWLRGWRGRFVSDTIQITLAHLGTWRHPDADSLVDRGACVWWDASWAAVEHADACVLEVVRSSLYAATLVCVAGGQRVTGDDVKAGSFTADKLGKRCIKLMRREVTFGGLWWVDQANGRKIRGVLDS